MNSNYSNDPRQIGQYFLNTDVLVSKTNLAHNIDPFSNHSMPHIEQKVDNTEIMTTKPRSSVPDQFEQIGTKVSKSCNMPGITINRFENPHSNVQSPHHIIQNEDFRGGIPSRIVTKDTFVKNMKK
jgi:hypothetical protein